MIEAKDLTDAQASLGAIMDQANAILRNQFFPGRIIQISLIAERRIVEAIVRHDDGYRHWSYIAAIFANPVTLAASCYTDFIANRFHSITSTILPDFKPEDHTATDMSDGFYLNAPGYTGEAANPIDEELAAVEDMAAAVANGRRLN